MFLHAVRYDFLLIVDALVELLQAGLNFVCVSSHESIPVNHNGVFFVQGPTWI